MDPKYTTTLNAIREHSPCPDGWSKLLRTLSKTRADDEPLHLLAVLESNGLDDALWCLRAVPGIDREARLYAVWCARQVQHLMSDPRSIAALDVAERFANGLATQLDLDAARAAASAAASAAAWAAASAAAWAAAKDAAWDAACDAAWTAAKDAAWDAACDAAWTAAWAAAKDAACDAAWTAAWTAAKDAARDAQHAKFRLMLSGVWPEPLK